MNLIETSIRRRVTIAMVTFTLFLFGLIALSDLKVNLLPDLSYPTLTVRTEYTGAAPAEIETLISKPVEEAVGVVKGLYRLQSVSRTGQSDVVLQFAWGTDMDKASLEVRDKLEVLQLPLEAKQPVLLRFNPSTEPIMRLVLMAGESSDAMPIQQRQAELMRLRRFADDELKKRLEPITGVAAVKISGGLEDEVQVLIDQKRLAQLHLPIEQVIDRLAKENINISGGRIEEGSQRYLVRTINQFASVDEMRELLLTPMNGVALRLKDVASVEQGYKEREAIIRMDGREAVELAIYKEGDANTVSVADAVRPALDRLKDQLPQGASLSTVEDQSVFIREALSEVRSEALIGGLLAIIIIFIFLRHAWSTFVIGLSLPVSIVATFFFMGQFGLDLNVMSLAGLALATGMVVDDSIVVLESIAKARERGLGLIEAALVGTQEVSMAVVASTLTTVAVFLPMVFVQGIAGQLFRDQALTVAIALMISLLISLTLIPMLSSLAAKAPLSFADEAHKAAPRLDDSLSNFPGWLLWPLVTGQSNGAARIVGFMLLLPIRLPLFVYWFVQPYFSDAFRTYSRWIRWPLSSARSISFLRIVGFILILPFKVPLLVIWLVWFLGIAATPALFLASFIATVVFRVVGKVLGFLMWLLGWPILRVYDAAAKLYARILPKALEQPVLVLGSATIAFGLSLWMASGLGLDLIPQFAQDRFEITARLPPGTRLDETDSLVRAIQAQHAGDEGVKAIFGVSGTGTRLDANPTESGENVARISVVLAHGAGSEVEAAETERMRQTLAQYPSVDAKFGRPQLLSVSNPLEIELHGNDLDALQAAGRKLTALMRESDRFVDIKSSVEQGFPEIQIRFDQERAAALGLTTRQIADQVVKKVRGEVATRYSFRDRKIDVLVRASEDDRSSIEDIRQLIVNPQSDRPITLATVAAVVETIGPSEINRIDQSRAAIVSAGVRYGDLGSAVAEVQRLVDANPLAAGVQMHVGGQGEELDQSRNSLLFAFGLAIFLVYLVMASQFESLLHPFVILFTIPLAVVGAVLALVLSGNSVSVVVFIGLILLVGIVVKNAIVLIDKVNQLREAGQTKREALIEGANSRLRPIIMTTLTTLFGFAPLAFFGGEGAEVRAPMALTVIGGLSVSTLLTLVVIPVVYDLLDRRPDAVYRERAERARRTAAISHAEHELQGTDGATEGA